MKCTADAAGTADADAGGRESRFLLRVVLS